MVTAACSGETPEAGASEDELIQEIADAFFRSTEPPEGVPAGLFTESDARCWAESLVAAVDRDTLTAAGFGSAEGTVEVMPDVSTLLDEKSAVVYVEAATKCLDFAKFIASDMVQGGVAEEFAHCVAEEMVAADEFASWMAASLLGGAAEMPGFAEEAMQACSEAQE
jgi:hypothetical protein